MAADFDEFLDVLKQLVRQPSVVGAELAFFRTLQRELDEVAAKVTLYEGLLVAQGTRPQSAYVSAHIDRHGLICTGPNEFQYAAFVARNRGDLLGDSVSENTFRNLAGRFHDQAVQAYNPWSGAYMGSGTIVNSYLCERRGNVMFEVSGLEHVLPGTPVAYLDRLTTDNGHLTAQLDNILTAAMLVHSFRYGFEGTAFFTAQEEAGRSWRFLYEWFRRAGTKTDRLLVLDTSPFGDREAADAQQVVLRRRDANAPFNTAMVTRLEEACARQGFTYLYKDEAVQAKNALRVAQGKTPLSLGSTELGRLAAATSGEINGATLQVPTTGYHTPNETATVIAVRAAMSVLQDVACPPQAN
jgi:putative aminopeptidase FrvX